ncbi:T-lymphocyte activation antigen CD86 [Thunnus albacares]|uniref:T-lymphocyte activation antigen CD86 n=1 Tax=Thunnus albacares TaxID=8236 RepID=UPI001CF6BB90|nr:T-lymphocyte activation antigen CD86 [Thunnus albacares]
MMALSWNLQCFRNQWLSLRPLTLVLAVIGFFSVTESVVQTSLRGEVGQNVTFHCPSEKQRTIKLFYFQRDNKFVNGFHALKNVPEPWENTRLNKTAVQMFNLKVSHSGNYDCIIQYSDNQFAPTHIHLSVTANYSKPNVTISCDKNHGYSCLVICASQGGYPQRKMRWSGAVTGNTSSQMWKVLNSSEVPDPNTMLFNSSSTASFNCSYGEQKFLSCSVGNVTSELFNVCVPQEPADNSDDHSMIARVAAICAVVVVVIGLMFLKWTCRKQRQAGAAAGAVMPEEVIVLRGINKEEEAS